MYQVKNPKRSKQITKNIFNKAKNKTLKKIDISLKKTKEQLKKLNATKPNNIFEDYKDIKKK